MRAQPLHSQPGLSPTDGISNFTSQHSFTMPRRIVDLPEFYGRAEDWPMFSTTYDETTSAYNYSNLENCMRLQKSLKGEAREVVKSLLIHPQNVVTVMEQLRLRFGRPEQLIRSQLQQIREIPAISEASVEKLVPFATKTNNLAVFLQSVNGQHHLSNPTLLDELITKLPMSKRIEWASYAASIQPYATIVDFSNWLNAVASLISTIQDSCSRTQAETKRRVVLHAADGQRNNSFKCPFCHGQHKVISCKKFLDCDVHERWTEVKRGRLCFTCLDVGHMTRNCRRRKQCGVNGCSSSHHKLLHEHRNNTVERPPSPQSDQREVSAVGEVLSCAVNTTESSKLLFRVLPVTLYGPKKRIDAYALLDEGSSVTMIDRGLTEELGLEGQKQQLSVRWFGGKATQEPSIVVNLHISGVTMKRRHMLRNVFSVLNLQLPTQSLNCSDLGEMSMDIKRLKLLPYSDVTPKLLIGLDHCHLGLPVETLSLKPGGPFASKTELGWIVFGPTQGTVSTSASCLMTSVASEDALHELVEDYFHTESFGVRPAPVVENEADLRAKNILEATTVRINGRFQTGLLWKSDRVELPDSYAMAKKRLIAIERKMQRDNSFAVAYNDIIRSYIAKNYARKLPPAEAAIIEPRTWYLPHFAVTNPNKPGKLRLVFDAAATTGGTSLNMCLLKGPQQYQPMPSVLFNFRIGAVAICGDIREMFHQVLIQPKDRCAQRFLWRAGNDDQPPDVYEMMVMTFGAACSPCAAQYIKTVNALEHRGHEARAVKAILKYHYIDDFVDSFDTIEEAIRIAKQVREIHKDAGFELRSFASNEPDVINALVGGEEPTMVMCDRPIEDSLATEKVLGMYWQPSTDAFRYHLKFHRVDAEIVAGKRRPTKRELLSMTMSVFDPLGFLCHFLIGAKLLMREVWKRDIRWDELLPDDINAAWSKWCSNISHVVKFQIPRHYFIRTVPKQVQLHIFVDASEDAFAAVAYWRVIDSNGKATVAFVCAKTKCAPLKPMTIPRLELQAAVLGTRLMQMIVDEHSIEITRCFLWSDSKTVVQNWIKSKNRRYKPFVAHRIAEILAATKPSNWRWISTEDNVADEATRPNYQVNFSPESRWLSGPEFLTKNEDMWPADPAIVSCHAEEDVEELQPKFAILVVSEHFINFTEFSSFIRLKRTIGWVVRFVNRCRQTHHPEEDHGLSVAELDEAETVLCRQAQTERYAVELSQIGSGQDLAKGSALYKLSPYVDDSGVLRVSGRIDAASWLPYTTRRPIILPPDHPLTELIVFHHHCQMKHQNIEATICEIRHKFWIPRLRQVLRKIIFKCCVCKIARVSPVTPILGQLPRDRLTPYVRPFSYTGLDYFGPLTITIGRRQEKRWVALFTCLVVRAIHLEVARDLSTDACIIAIRNFINRRGVPVRIRSDNGKNFVGADQVARRFPEVFECERIQDELSSRGVEWLFNCPNNPSEGGVWERMVQCVKKVLRHTLREIAPREHTLQCLIIEAENVVNSRPLTHLPISIDQEEPLTPNHFLLGAANTAQTPCLSEPPERLCALNKQWRIARQLRDRFWKRWIAEYLPTLTCRTKWCQKTTPLKEGDLVFICDSNMPRKQWCRGRVQQVYYGADGEIRQADVSTRSGVYRRPVSKLAVLNVDSGESSRSTGAGM